MTQFFVSDLTPYQKIFFLDKNSSEFTHIIKSHRSSPNDILQFFNGKGWIFKVKIKNITKDKAEFEILEKKFFEKPQKQLILCQSIIKIDKFELILEKATEIGVDIIVPIHTKRTQIPIEKFEKKYQRFKTILIESAKQSDRAYIPEFYPYHKIEDIFLKFEGLNVVLYKNSKNTFEDLKEEIKKTKMIKIFVGPEGDFSSEEIIFFKNQKDTYFVHLTDTTLRTETAAIVALGVLSIWRNIL